MYFKLLTFVCILTVGYSYSINSRSPRLIGAHDAEPGEVPHQVSLQLGLLPKFPYQHFCGGSILNEYWILTAAHCVESFKNSTIYTNPNVTRLVFKVIAGKNNIKEVEGSEQTASVEAFFMHENFTGVFKGVISYDIALLRLENPLKFNDKVAPIKLPERDDEVSENVQISGWGELGVKDKMPSVLKIETVPIFTGSECLKALQIFSENENKKQNDNKTVTIDHPKPEDDKSDDEKTVNVKYLAQEDTLCTGPLTGGISVCRGDSGGPMTAVNKQGQLLVAGIVAWALSPCGLKGAPSGFTNVAYHLDWIYKTMSENKKISQ